MPRYNVATGLKDLYTDEDVAGPRDVYVRRDTGEELGVVPQAPAIEAPTAPTTPTNGNTSGLMDMFKDLVGRAQGAKWHHTAQMYAGLANTVAGMIGQPGATQEAATYHGGHLQHLAKTLGLDVEKFGFEKEKLGEETTYHKRYLDILEAKPEMTAENAMEKARQMELAALNRQRTAGLQWVAKKYGEPKMEERGMLGKWWTGQETKPNIAMEKAMAFESAHQAGLKDIYQRYGAGGSSIVAPKPVADEEPPWKRILRGASGAY